VIAEDVDQKMGINSSTRRVTVVNDNETGVIRISESVVQKISQTQHHSNDSQPIQRPPPQSSQPVPQSQQQQQSPPQRRELSSDHLFVGSQSSREEHEREIRRLEQSWKTQIQELQKQNRQLWSTANENLSTNITDVEKNLVKQKCDPICRQHERLVVDCYHSNRSQPLKCSKEVKAFVDCVHQVRRSVLNRNG